MRLSLRIMPKKPTNMHAHSAPVCVRFLGFAAPSSSSPLGAPLPSGRASTQPFVGCASPNTRLAPCNVENTTHLDRHAVKKGCSVSEPRTDPKRVILDGRYLLVPRRASQVVMNPRQHAVVNREDDVLAVFCHECSNLAPPLLSGTS